jgi:DNA-binding HxlR family transcriptional regulator
MGEPHAHTPALCLRFHRASELIGRRWTGAIIFVLLKARCRFAVLREAIPDITDRMLSERLQELEQEGIVERTVIPDTPVRVEYSLTRKGRALAAPVDAIVEWAHRWVPLEAAAPQRGQQRPTPTRAAGRRAERRPQGRQGSQGRQSSQAAIAPGRGDSAVRRG